MQNNKKKKVEKPFVRDVWELRFSKYEASHFSMHSWYIYSTVFVGCIYNLYIKKEVNEQTSLNIVFAPVSS